ncbi:MAG: hypothetical protein LCH32_08050 [Bacteroidetes bacterium]|nr:hypothetical protein [Bacteroidota bacterium]
MNIIIKNKLKEIFSILNETPTNINNLGLIDGWCGISLFKKNYSLINSKIKLNNDVEEFLLKNFESYLKNNSFDPHLTNGISGIFWYLSYLKNKRFLYLDNNKFFNDFENYLDKILLSDCEYKNYDILYGSIGTIVFYKESGILHRKKKLQKKIIEIIANQAIYIENNSIRWVFASLRTKSINNDEVNFGLSHGIPSLISCLLKFDREFDNLTRPLVFKSINNILNFENNSDSNYFNYFPDILKVMDNKTTDYKSRLAWCYGDLGIACMLWNAGSRYSVQEWKMKAVDIVIKTTFRKVEEKATLDIGLCHGSAGIAHIYNRFYNYTNDLRIKEASLNWLEKTLELANFSDQFSKYNTNNQDAIVINDPSFLTGMSGVGLSLIGFLNPKTMDWDRCLQIT